MLLNAILFFSFFSFLFASAESRYVMDYINVKNHIELTG